MKKFNLSDIALIIFDLDGVIYRGNEPICSAVESIKRYYNLNKKIAFFTNNSTLTRDSFCDKIRAMNISCSPEQVYTSSVIAADSLMKLYKESSTAFVIGETGLITSLCNNNIKVLNDLYTNEEIISNGSIECEFVIVGLDTTLTYHKLAAATQLISRGADFYATNDDASLPSNFGLLPGAGAIVKFIEVTTGIKPISVFGKPSPEGIYQILNNFKISPENALMIGDRPETDILCGKKANIQTALVLTGVTTKSDIMAIPEYIQPDIIIEDLIKL